jgi:hypothetical protein
VQVNFTTCESPAPFSGLGRGSQGAAFSERGAASGVTGSRSPGTSLAKGGLDVGLLLRSRIQDLQLARRVLAPSSRAYQEVGRAIFSLHQALAGEVGYPGPGELASASRPASGGLTLSLSGNKKE